MKPTRSARVSGRRNIPSSLSGCCAESLTVKCPACGATWPVPTSDLTSDKRCGTCGHTWSPTLADYPAAAGKAGSRAQHPSAAPSPSRATRAPAPKRSGLNLANFYGDLEHQRLHGAQPRLRAGARNAADFYLEAEHARLGGAR